MTPSIFDYRGNEIETAQRIRRERIMNAIGAAIAIPALAACAVFMILVLACA